MPVGGLRDRLIHDSIFNWVQNGVALLGWIDPGRQHQPITFLKEMKTWEEQLPPNTITIAPADQTDEDWELGSFGFRNETIYYIDVYAEDIDRRNASLGQHLSGDIRDLLRGKFDAIGYDTPTVTVYDYTQASPPALFYVDIDKVRRDRAVNYPKKFERQLWVIEFSVTDWYGSQESGETQNVSSDDPFTGVVEGDGSDDEGIETLSGGGAGVDEIGTLDGGDSDDDGN